MPAACSSSRRRSGRRRRRQAFELANVAHRPGSRAARGRIARRRAAGRYARPPRRRHPQPDALRVSRAVHQGAGLIEQAGAVAAAACAGTASPTRPACWRRSRRWAPCCSALRAAGAEVGWGFQLQSPVTVAVLAYVLFAMGLSLSGVFHLGIVAAGRWATSLTRRSGLAGSFFAGALAAVVATPCTAPFMGTAVGFALTQPAGCRLAVFLALGLGLALPFLLLTLAPQLIGRLPRPGAWMETLQAAAGLPGLRHGRLAGLGAGPAGRPGRPVRRPDRPRADRLSPPGRSTSAQTAGAWGRRVATGSRRRLAGRRRRRRRRPGAATARPAAPRRRHPRPASERFTPAPPRRAARRATAPCSST